MTKNALTHKELIFAADLLRQYCTCINERAVYATGWDDNKIFAELKTTIPGITLVNIQGLRRKLIGEIKFAPNPNSNQLHNLLSRLGALEAWAAARPVSPYKGPTP
jgi:hypothetical protein